jgi:hypothetical protein
MTIRPNMDLRRRAETHLATITAPSDFIFFHVDTTSSAYRLKTTTIFSVRPCAAKRNAHARAWAANHLDELARFFCTLGLPKRI